MFPIETDHPSGILVGESVPPDDLEASTFHRASEKEAKNDQSSKAESDFLLSGQEL